MNHFIKNNLSFFKKNIVLFAIIVIIIYSNFNIKRWEDKSVIKWDITSYYGYLPALFIHNDLTLKFIEGKEAYYSNNQMFWPETSINGGKVIKTTMGMSVLYAPFFAIGHLEAHLTNQDLDGFSVPYHKWIHLSAILYLFIGLLFLHKYLSKKFNNTSSALTLLSIALGTNLFYYATTEAAMSHIYSFSLICIFIYYYDSWHHKASFKKSIFLGVIIGLIILVRPVNIIIAFFALLYNVKNSKTLKYNLHFIFRKNLKSTITILILCGIIFLPQLIYWKIITDNWLFSSYVGERFYFTNTHIIDLLFSFRKGWLLYTPIMSISIIGFIILYRKNKELFWSSFSVFIISIYLLSSWWCWWYGGSFGIRAMIDIYPFLSIPLASLVFHIFNSKRKFIPYILPGLLIIFICLNLFQTLQYRRAIIHWDSMTKEAYLEGFGKLKVGENFNTLFKSPDYDNARKGIEEYSTNK